MSTLRQLRDQWDRLGRSDPFWAVLTNPDKRNRRWTADEFFETGTSEIAAVLDHARTLGLRFTFGRALDFGCGVGRITQALADHFERSDGVDISPSMLEKAARYNRHAGRCQYHLNETTDLRLFGDSTFDFAYSVLVLQHTAPGTPRRTSES
jgi:SAM-dependent methyltransferase